jgi:DNA-binding response OmpR family regulator
MNFRSESLAASAGDLDPVIAEVRTRFIADFPLRCDTAASLVENASQPDARAGSARSLRALAHRMVGLAGVIGFSQVSAIASELEDLADRLETGGASADAAHALIASLRAAFAQELGESVAIGAAVPQPAARGHVLVAEDDDEQRLLVATQLARAGYSVRGVASGDEVIAAARAVPPSVVLLDVEIPGADGFALCRQLRADPAFAAVPIVLMTARGGVDDRLAGLSLGADDYLIKPVDPRELVIRLERVRARGEARETPADAALSYEVFVRRARTRLRQSPASLALLRVPGERLHDALSAVTDETRRADLVAVFDRTHLVILLPDLTGPAAPARILDIIGRLEPGGALDVTAGIACALAGDPMALEKLMAKADAALVRARYLGRAIVVHGEAEEPAPSQSGASVLIADDDPDVMRIVDAQLRSAGHRTRLAFDGVEALASIEESAPDVLIVDLMMPRLGGFDLLARLRRTGRALPAIVVLSARGREDDVMRAFELGADDYVTKPFNPRELLARVARLLR